MEKAFSEGGLASIKEYLDFLNKQLNSTVLLVRQKLTYLARVSVNALIVIDVHAKDVIGRLFDERIDDVNAFEWVSQLRYYWSPDDQEVD